MLESYQLTVQDVLQTRHFQHAKVIAGEQGLHRVVKWVHIIELPQVSHLVNGQELILTTGVGWGASRGTRLSFLQQLIDHHASAVCIELYTYFHRIPEELIDLANRHHLPLIVFTREVRFVDITRDLHTRLIQYTKQNEAQKQWLLDWLKGKLTGDEVNQYLAANLKLKENWLGVVLIVKPKAGEKEVIPLKGESNQPLIVNWRSSILWTARSILEEMGWTVLSLERQDEIVFFLFYRKKSVHQNKTGFPHETAGWKTLLKQTCEKILATTAPLPLQIGAGQPFDCAEQLAHSLKTAEQTLKLQRQLNRYDIISYDDFGIYPLLSMMEQHYNLHDFIETHIGAVINYDREHGTQLLPTLKTYLACQGSKQETAKQLYIVRQTLYHRLNKLEELLGKDFMSFERRVAIECGLLAYELGLVQGEQKIGLFST
ncbi:transcriptional regulator, CdaR [Caldalkalibacillus thermarum TA2.A1]|uniref:PucR family transcriptional regulator ligand-binding domain-containing protein n=1 Tax=Caldalkalibacillus thermarum (strain TA2.A1) TaxID=986075 RepID=F5L3E3_CALTT|nr:PucR family transcriptional regulator [Caldalkalibacillus thermarum]EGL84138.1 transcriptional regulator, CdaR [Caldalkalibacillus thermarum TA2.A1]QZT34114.1 PucR family transcriptional regulator ligand-binding domain-containing protein [Caldalkalibacillus thermarum TA2.A1]